MGKKCRLNKAAAGIKFRYPERELEKKRGKRGGKLMASRERQKVWMDIMRG
jgi:hypothetical protein